jgi:hypothetical protein
VGFDTSGTECKQAVGLSIRDKIYTIRDGSKYNVAAPLQVHWVIRSFDRNNEGGG